MEKSPEAFRTISEVADLLDTPAHVLRFWESRFPQVRPVKRAGGRRYYRPGDVALLAGIKKLLHDDGLTIRGVQKILREQGIRHVSGLAAPLPDAFPGSILPEAQDEPADEAKFFLSVLSPAMTPGESAQIIPLEQVYARQEAQRMADAQQTDGRLADAPAPMADAEPEHIEDAPEAPFIEAEEAPDFAEELPLFASALEGPDSLGDAGMAQGGDQITDEPPPDAAGLVAMPETADASAAEDAPSVEETASPAAAEAMDDAAQPMIASLLRRRRPVLSEDRRADLLRLHDRLADLRDRVAEASRRRIR